MSGRTPSNGSQLRARVAPQPVPFHINTRRRQYAGNNVPAPRPSVVVPPVVANVSRSPTGRIQVHFPAAATAQGRIQPPVRAMVTVQDLLDAIANLANQFNVQHAQQTANANAVQQQLQQAINANNALVAALAASGGGAGGGGTVGGTAGGGAARVRIDNFIVESIPKSTGGPGESPD